MMSFSKKRDEWSAMTKGGAMKRFCLVLLLAITVYMIPSQAAAADSNYIVVKPVIYTLQTKSLKHYNTGFNGEIAFGHQFNPYVAVEAGLGYFNSEATFRDSDRISGITYPFRENNNYEVVPITLSAKLIRPAGKWEFFGVGGAGAYIVSLDTKVTGTVDGWSGRVSLNDTDTVFGFHLGMGFQYNITPKLFIGGEGKYLWIRQARLKDSRATSPVIMDAKPRMDGVLATAVIGFRF